MELPKDDIRVKGVKGVISSEGLSTTVTGSKINSISLNQNQMYFAVGTESGFEIIPNDAAVDSINKRSKYSSLTI
jgi:hypothetical protein